MGLADILRSGIAIADTVTKGVQVNVTHEAWTGQNGHGTETYAAAVTRKAIVDLTRKQRPTASGKLVNVVATVIILEPVLPNGAAGRFEPIDPRDKLTLPDGTTGPILNGPNSVMDPATSRGLFNEIYLGEIDTTL